MSGDLKWFGDKAKRTAHDGGAAGAAAAAEALLQRTLPKVPRESGELRDSGHVQTDGTQAAVIFDTPYAVRQHEDTSLRHHGGGQAKFLERTLHDDQPALLEALAAELRKALGGD